MNVNFEIEDNYALNYNGRHIDLHNNFSFVSYNFDVSKRQFNLVCAKSFGNWVPGNELSRLEIIHSNVSYLAVRYDHNTEYPKDDKCLGEISYCPSAEREINNEFTTQTKPNDDDDILYTFESGGFIRVGCREIELIIE